MNNVAQNLEPLKNKLRNHSLYNSIESVEDLKIFTNAHVYAVWDFMSLLKYLQINLTTISVPWYPSRNNSTAKLINEIVAGEETDENEDGRPMSHFEMYLDSIESFGVKTDSILNNINSLNSLDTINNDIEKLKIEDYIKDFLKFTFSVINRGKILLNTGRQGQGSKNDEEKISEAKSISEKALLSRISLWDGIENEIKTKYKYYEKV